MLEKYLTIIFSLIMIGCNSKIYTYERSVDSIDETIIVNYRKNSFQYFSNNKGQNYTAKGTINIDDSVITFDFPPYAESDSLSPFKKGYFELAKIKESGDIILHMSFTDLKWDFLSPKIDNLDLVSVVSSLDSFPIKKVNPINIKNNLKRSFLSIEDPFYYRQLIKIPQKGEYFLKVYLQQRESVGAYETTNTGCYYVISNPTLELYICKKGDKKIIAAFCPDKNCQQSYEITNVK